jgi:hypothetical protein
MDRTNHHSTPTNDQTVLQHFHILPSANYKGMELEEICLLSTKNQSSSGHCYIEHYIVQKLVLVK